MEFDDPSAVAMQVAFQIYDGAISALPDGFLVERSIPNSLAPENLGVDADDQHLLIIGSVEDTDPPAFWKVTGGSPQKIVLQFRRAGMPIAEYLTALRIDPRHHVLDRAILPRSVHRLEY